MNIKRAPCPVVTCSHDMPANSPMCMPCWEKVPADLRQQIYLKAPGSASYKELHARAMAIATVASAAKVSP